VQRSTKQISLNLKNHPIKGKAVSEDFQKQIVQRIGRNFLDIMILRLASTQPTWGYKIIQTMKTNYNVKLSHSALYPLLNALEKSGFLQSKQEKHKGRVRKIYVLTPKGIQLIETYNKILNEQLEKKDLKEKTTNNLKNTQSI
jgi:DNA-binding PadR family transcriptional regulator